MRFVGYCENSLIKSIIINQGYIKALDTLLVKKLLYSFEIHPAVRETIHQSKSTVTLRPPNKLRNLITILHFV